MNNRLKIKLYSINFFNNYNNLLNKFIYLNKLVMIADKINILKSIIIKN